MQKRQHKLTAYDAVGEVPLGFKSTGTLLPVISVSDWFKYLKTLSFHCSL